MRKITHLLLAAALLGACTSVTKYQSITQRDVNQLTRSASFDMPNVQVPTFQPRTWNVLDFGADPTGM